jgi:hypothetical protein
MVPLPKFPIFPKALCAGPLVSVPRSKGAHSWGPFLSEGLLGIQIKEENLFSVKYAYIFVTDPSVTSWLTKVTIKRDSSNFT